MGESSSTVNKRMRQLNTYHNGMAGYLMDFGFGGFIGYGKGVSCTIGNGRAEYKHEVLLGR